MSTIYILWNCDEWKSLQSMRIRMVSGDRAKIEASILTGIENDDFDYTGTPDQNYRENMANEFRHDCQTRKSFYEINNALRFGMVGEFEDGVEL